MSRLGFNKGGPAAAVRLDDDSASDREEDVLVDSYKEQVQYDDLDDDLDAPPTSGKGMTTGSVAAEDLSSRMRMAAEPLGYEPTMEMRFSSYDNYCTMFHIILNSETPVDVEMPNFFWAWDCIDEFIYQFMSFCRHRNKVAADNNDAGEVQVLRDNPNTWGCYNVLNILYSLIQRSQMNEQIVAIKRGEDPMAVAGEYGQRQLYRMLGYFSIVGLLRVHCLLGDFSLALKTLDDIELNKKSIFARVMAAHFTTYYYVGFSYMMMRRYADAIRMFSHILVYVSRTKNFSKTAQYDSISRMNEQMYALIAICVALNPTRLDDTIHSALREKHADAFARIQRGGMDALPVFEKLFRDNCPRFITPTPPDFDNPAVNVDPTEHHTAIFLQDVKNALFIPILKSYLKLYTTMDLKKLSSFLDTDPEKLRTYLLVAKQRSRNIRWTEGGLLDGEVVASGDLDFAVEGNMVQISEARVGRRLVEWYLRNLGRTY